MPSPITIRTAAPSKSQFNKKLMSPMIRHRPRLESLECRRVMTITFVDSGQSIGNETTSLTLGDLDGDGDIDAFETSRNGSRVWMNDGAGNYAEFGQTLGRSAMYSSALGDLDADGDLDALILGDFLSGDALRILWNDGTGKFTHSGQEFFFSGYDLAHADLDGDGDLDAVSGQVTWINDGLGRLSEGGNLDSVTGLALGDVDGDGDMDAFIGTREDAAMELWIYESKANPSAGDANGDLQFDQADIVQVLQAGKFLSGAPATFEEGDWNGDDLFDQMDIVEALQTGNYLQGPYAVQADDISMVE